MAMRGSSYGELKPRCETALGILDIMFECATILEGRVASGEETARLTQVFRAAQSEIQVILNLCTSRPMQTRFFCHAYGSRLTTSFQNVDNAWLAWIEGQKVGESDERFGALCDRMREARRALDRREAVDAAYDEKYEAMLKEAREFRGHGSDTNDAATFLAKAKVAALEAQLARDEEDWMRQMMLIGDARDELREIISAAKSAEGQDVADDEDFLRAMIEAEHEDVHMEPDDALARRQRERDVLFERIEAEQVIFTAICAVVRLVQPNKQRALAHLAPIVTPPSSTQSEVLAGKSQAAERRSSSKSSLDGETMRLVRDSLGRTTSDIDVVERDQFNDARVQAAYDAGTTAKSKDERPLPLMRGSFGDLGEALGGDAATPRSLGDDAASTSSYYSAGPGTVDVADVCLLLTAPPVRGHAKIAHAATAIADACGLDDGAVERENRDLVRTSGGLRVLVQLLNMHCSVVELDEIGRALWALACHNQENRKAMMIDEGILPVIIARVGDKTCDTRFLTPLWRTLDADSPAHYARGLADSSATIVELLLIIVRASDHAGEVLLAARALLVLLYAQNDEDTNPTANATAATGPVLEDDDATTIQPSNWRALIVNNHGLKALATVLTRRLLEDDAPTKADDEPSSKRGKYKGGLATAAKDVAAQAIFDLVSPLAQQGIRGDLVTIEGASGTIAAFNSVDLEDPNSDLAIATLALTRHLFAHFVSVAKTATSPLLAVTAIKSIVTQLAKATETPGGALASWVIKEQAAKALRRLVKAADKEPSLLGASEIVEIIASEQAIAPLVDVLKDESDVWLKYVLLAKQEAARVVKLLADANRANVAAIVARGAIPALVKLIDAVNQDDPKEAGVTALHAICNNSRQYRNMVVNSPRGIKVLMQLVARTATNASDEASSRLLYAIAIDDPDNEQFIRLQRDVFGDMMRTLDWNVTYGETLNVKSAGKLLRDRLKVDDDAPPSRGSFKAASGRARNKARSIVKSLMPTAVTSAKKKKTRSSSQGPFREHHARK